MAKLKTPAEYLRDRPQAPNCSACNRLVEECADTAVACLCATCTMGLAHAEEVGTLAHGPAATCPDCGTELPSHRRHGRCEACQHKANRAKARERVRRHRHAGLL